jgi:hypothetical protein
MTILQRSGRVSKKMTTNKRQADTPCDHSRTTINIGQLETVEMTYRGSNEVEVAMKPTGCCPNGGSCPDLITFTMRAGVAMKLCTMIAAALNSRGADAIRDINFF